MKDYCGIRCGIDRLIEVISFNVYAEEGEEPPKSEPINYEDLIAKARKEEKDKQYSTIEKLKGEKNALTEQHNGDLLKIADLEKQLNEAKSSKAPTVDTKELEELKNTVKALTEERDGLSTRVKEFEAIKPISREEVVAEVRADLEKEYEVKSYRLSKLTEMKDDILVPELVIGTTKEEIDASLESALNRSNEIRKSLGIDKKRTPKSASNPSISGAQDIEVSLEKLATMDVRSKEYAELRKQLGLR